MNIIRGYNAGLEVLGKDRLNNWAEPSKAIMSSIHLNFGHDFDLPKAITKIITDVREQGDSGVNKYTELFDKVLPPTFEVPKEEWLNAYRHTPKRIRKALEVISDRVTDFHKKSLPQSWIDYQQGFGELFTPISKVGIYVPGGTASYPSTVLMTAIPAKVAGVGEVILCSPSRGGRPDQLVLPAAYMTGVDKVFQIGGAQAIAAMAYGTESVPRVDLISGPGNLFVTTAKQLVYGDVAIDGLYGPTETVIIADHEADPNQCAADLIAQGEHDPMACPVFLTTSEELWDKVSTRIDTQLKTLPRKEIAMTALNTRGTTVIVDNLDQAIDLANTFAPEHLCLLVKNPWDLVRNIKHAGGVFIGPQSPEVMGDYVAGPSHVMPTSGTARFNSPLGVHHFLKVSSLVGLDESLFEKLAPHAMLIAQQEGLVGHRKAMALRKKGNRG